MTIVKAARARPPLNKSNSKGGRLILIGEHDPENKYWIRPFTYSRDSVLTKTVH